MPQPEPRGRAERTRAALLDASETLFAERGFAATRLEEIAERVGIRRASIVYYYRDKRELYDAMIERVLGDLFSTLETALQSEEALSARIEAGISAWVDFVGTRPSLARIVLREAADSDPERGTALLQHSQRFYELIFDQILSRPDFAETRFNPIDPVHLASTVVGATVFLVVAMPALVPDLPIDVLSREHLESHKNELLRIVRRLLGTRGPHLHS
jgi:TetR/AcrR family transcriptional regulator